MIHLHVIAVLLTGGGFALSLSVFDFAWDKRDRIVAALVGEVQHG